MSIPENIIDIILSHPDDGIAQHDLDLLREWIGDSPQNEKAYNDFMALSRSMKWGESWNAVDKSEAWKKISEQHRIGKRRRSLRRISVAASVALIIGVSGWMAFTPRGEVSGEKPAWVPNQITLLTTAGTIIISGSDALEIEEAGTKINADSNTLAYDAADNDARLVIYNTLLIPRGMQHTLRLSDGSTIVLNSETKIKYPVNFPGDTREVYLEGEAYFDVEKNPGKPFIVHSANTSVQVLGTQFNFSAYADEPTTIVTLVEGAVQVGSDGGIAATLTPGDQYSRDNSTGQYAVKVVDTYMYTSWSSGVFRFEAMPLEKVMNKLSKWFDIEYEFRDESLKSKRYTGGFRKDSDVKVVLEAISASYDVAFKMRGDKAIIEKK